MVDESQINDKNIEQIQKIGRTVDITSTFTNSEVEIKRIKAINCDGKRAADD